MFIHEFEYIQDCEILRTQWMWADIRNWSLIEKVRTARHVEIGLTEKGSEYL